MIFTAIANWAKEKKFPVSFMCKQLGVSEQGYYAFITRPSSPHSLKDDKLKEEILSIYKKSDENPGVRMLHADLIAKGENPSPKRVWRLMRELGIQGCHKRARNKTTIQGEHEDLPDFLNRDFTASAPNEKWVSDITYIRVGTRWAYLAVIIDLFSRSVVGWALLGHMKTDLVTSALKDAIWRRRPKAGLILGSDRGSQYTSSSLRAVCEEHGVRQSFGKTGVCYDNAVAESFFATYKRELISKQKWTSLKELEFETFKWIEGRYNTLRRHSYLGYLTPLEYELGYRNIKELAA